ncbi:MAG: ISNCY-like element ISAtsp9 family transposase [Dongiaceae bacterium]
METLERLLASLRECCAGLPDKRTGKNGRYDMADIGLAAFSVFFMQSPSFLAHQQHLAQGQGRSNCETLFGMTAIPSDNHIRAMLDPVGPERFDPVFAATIAELEGSGGLAAFRRLGQHVLIALDGTEYFRSAKLSCANCSTRARTGGKRESFHSAVLPALVAPGHARVVPLEPEFIGPQDGQDKQDCESRAARRWLSAHGPHYARLAPVYLGDDLYSRQPVCEAVLAADGHFLFVCKPDSHPTLQEYLTGIELPEHVERRKHGRARFVYRYRWLAAVPLRDGKDALLVNWLWIEIVNPAGKVTYRNSFVTDLPVDAANVAELAACGRARWKIENETFNVLKTKGYNLEHNFGHGRENLAAVLATLNLLAFACHTVCDLAEAAWQQAMATLGRRTRFFETLRSLTVYLIFPSWLDLLATLAFARPPPPVAV